MVMMVKLLLLYKRHPNKRHPKLLNNILEHFWTQFWNTSENHSGTLDWTTFWNTPEVRDHVQYYCSPRSGYSVHFEHWEFWNTSVLWFSKQNVFTIVVIHETNLRHTRHVICVLDMRWQAKCVGQILPVYYERNLFKECGYHSIVLRKEERLKKNTCTPSFVLNTEDNCIEYGI